MCFLRTTRVVGFVVAAVLAALPFLRAWNFALSDLDDYAYLTANRLLTDWAGLESLRHFFSDVSNGIWMPLTWLSYAADFRIFGEWFGGFHLHSILLHAVNAGLVLVLLLEIESRAGARDRRLAFFACLIGALVWAAHPLRCESVVLLSSRKDVLSFFFELLALILWVRGGTVRTAFSLLLFVLGSMCKPSVMTFPALCLLIDVFVRREAKVLRYVAPFAYAVLLALFAGWQQKMGAATADAFGQPLWGRLLGACAAFGIYLRNFAWPLDLAPQCVKVWPRLPRFWLPGLVLSGMWAWGLWRTAFGYWARRAETVLVEKAEGVPVRVAFSFAANPVFVGAAWFAVAIAPMLGIANFGYHAFADRFTYIPAVGLSVLVVEGLVRLGERRGRAIPFALGVSAVALLGCMTWRQTGFWESDGRLYRHTLEVDGAQNACARVNVAKSAYEFDHDLETCVREYGRVVSENPIYALPTYEVYVIALCELGRVDEAAEKVKLLGEIVERLYGRAAAWKVLRGESDAPEDLKGLFAINRLSRLALWTFMEDGASSAEQMLGECDEKDFEKKPVLAYLRMKLAEKNGDAAVATRLREKFETGAFKDDYIRFRFLLRR